jgi:hypothetical protein
MSLWGTRPVRVNNFSTDHSASFNMDASFQMIPVEEPEKPLPVASVEEPVKKIEPIELPKPKPQINLEILQSIMPPGVIKRNAHLINLILKK